MLDQDKAIIALGRFGFDTWSAVSVYRALEACDVPDPRIARIEALCAEMEQSASGARYAAQDLRAALRGDA